MTLVVRVRQGDIEGEPVAGGAVRAFKGVPYAKPPVGDLRWRPPQPPDAWDGVRPAKRLGPAAKQLAPAPTSLYYGGETVQSEDCLYLNVWTGDDSSARRPVMVWLHFGAFQFGSGGNPLYDGTELARAGATVVTINYRLGRLGFLAHPELTAESAHGSSGNYGLLDQIAALEWVRDNIEAFGGDPGNVTLFGVSAGAHSVHCLRSSPLAEGLFHKVIAQSGVGFTHAIDGHGDPAAMQTLRAGEQAGLEVAELLGGLSIAEMRKLSADEILAPPLPRSAGVWNLAFLPPEIAVGLAVFDSGYPLIDNYVLPQTPRDVFAEGDQHDVPMIAGSAGNESSGLPFIARVGVYEDYVREAFGDRADEVLRLYPAGNDDEARSVSGKLYADRMFTWASWTATRLHQRTGTAPVYSYRFMHEPPLPAEGEIAERGNAGAFHGAELTYVFGTFGARDWPWTDADRRLGEQVAAYWLNFARTGDPNGDGLPEWPVFDEETASTLMLEVEPRVGGVPDRERLEFWESYYATWTGHPQIARA